MTFRSWEWMKAGDHAAILDDFETFKKYKPEAGFFQYLALVGCPRRGSPDDEG